MMKIMPRTIALLTVATCLPFVVRAAAAQGPESPTQGYDRYRVEFTINELEKGKVLNGRNYVMVVGKTKDPRAFGRIRVGSRVPYATKATEYQYSDVGMNIDCNISAINNDNDHVQADLTVASSSLASREQVSPTNSNPVFRNVSFQASPVLVLGKATVVSEVDDVASDHRYQIEMTVTTIK
jgi:hypothetical protein